MDKKKECKKCGGKMKRGIALQNTIAYAARENLARGETVWAGGPGKIIPAMKCERCGWSVTFDV